MNVRTVKEELPMEIKKNKKVLINGLARRPG
jgi:hypothetical protein